MFAEFLSYLSERMYKENNLSDITAAMIRSVPGFGKCLFKFFNASCPGEPMEVFREVHIGDSYRIDLVLLCGSNALYIENKIYDKEYHFGTYPDRIIANAEHRGLTRKRITKGLISYHRLYNTDCLKGNEEAFEIRYWDDFINFLDTEYGNETDKLSKAMVNGYIQYVKGVCGMVELNRVDVEGIKYASFLKTMLLGVIRKICSIDGYYCNYYPQGVNRASGDNYFGVFYELGPENASTDAKSAWVFIGAFFSKQKGYAPGIVIWLIYEWNKNLMNNMDGNEISTNSHYDCEKVNRDIFFSIPQDQYEEFQNSDENRQTDILGDFFAQVNRVIIKYCKGITQK